MIDHMSDLQSGATFKLSLKQGQNLLWIKLSIHVLIKAGYIILRDSGVESWTKEKEGMKKIWQRKVNWKNKFEILFSPVK